MSHMVEAYTTVDKSIFVPGKICFEFDFHSNHSILTYWNPHEENRNSFYLDH